MVTSCNEVLCFQASPFNFCQESPLPGAQGTFCLWGCPGPHGACAALSQGLTGSGVSSAEGDPHRRFVGSLRGVCLALVAGCLRAACKARRGRLSWSITSGARGRCWCVPNSMGGGDKACRGDGRSGHAGPAQGARVSPPNLMLVMPWGPSMATQWSGPGTLSRMPSSLGTEGVWEELAGNLVLLYPLENSVVRSMHCSWLGWGHPALYCHLHPSSRTLERVEPPYQEGPGHITPKESPSPRVWTLCQCGLECWLLPAV